MPRRLAVLASIVASCVLLLTVALAAGSPAIERWVIGAAGGFSAASGATLHGTLGQPIVGLSSSDHASVSAGYERSGGQLDLHAIYLPLVMRDH